MLKSIKTIFLWLFVISPIVLLAFYTVHTIRNERAKTEINVSNLKLVTPVAIIDEITKKLEEEDVEDAEIKINSELPDPNIPSSNGTPLIVLAAEKDYTDIVAALIQKGANPDKADLNTSETALIKAIKNQNFDTISVLLNAGANPNLGTNQGVTPLGLAIDLKNENLATHLLSSGATNGINKENLLLYAFRKNPIGVSLMLSGGVPPNSTDKNDNTPLIISAANNDLESAKQLISYRADINARNKYGMTPLLYALKSKNWEMAEYLMRNNAKINISNIYGQNALFWAAYHGNAKLVHDLLIRGANYQKKTRRGQTALQMAKALGHKEAAKMIEDYIAYKRLPRDKKGNIILPKVNEQNQNPTVSSPSQNLSDNAYLNNDIAAALKNQTQQTAPQPTQQVEQPQMQQIQQVQTVPEPSVQTSQTPAQAQQIPATKQNQLPVSGNQPKQQVNTQINDLQNNTANQAANPQMPQMPGGMDMSSIMSMVGGAQGAAGVQGAAATGNMGDMIKQMQNMGVASQGGTKTQQMQNMPANMQIPEGMNMDDVSKMIPAGVLPEGMDLNSLASMSPEQLKQMGVPEDQIANISKMQQQMGQMPDQSVTGGNGFKPKDLSNMSNTTYQNGVMKTKINKLQTSGN